MAEDLLANERNTTLVNSLDIKIEGQVLSDYVNYVHVFLH